jgi:hypothetical protein
MVLLLYVPGVQGGCCCFRLVNILRMYCCRLFRIFIIVASLWHSMVPYDSDCVSPVFCNDRIRTCHITQPSVAACVLSSPSLVPFVALSLSLSLDQPLAATRNSCCDWVCMSNPSRSIAVSHPHHWIHTSWFVKHIWDHIPVVALSVVMWVPIEFIRHWIHNPSPSIAIITTAVDSLHQSLLTLQPNRGRK